jgi:hypothetical protein
MQELLYPSDITNITCLVERLMSMSTSSSSSTRSPVSEAADLSGLPIPFDDMARSSTRDGVKLADVLGVLDHENESNIFIVRRISRLGHSANHVLVGFFCQFGPVKRIILLPSRGRGDSRTRPASMGFIVMENALDCAHICSMQSYLVGHVEIQVQKFTRNERVDLSDGLVVTKAYVNPSGKAPMSPQVLDSHSSTLSAFQLELLAKAVIDTLEI